MAHAVNYDVYKSMDALEAATSIDPSNFWAQLKYAELHYRLRALTRAEELTVIALNLATNGWQLSLARKQLQEIRRLSRDSTRNVTWNKPLTGPVAVGTIVLIALRWRLNVMSLPEDEARALGLATGPFRIAIVAAATLVTSASVATSGIIGWVGLVVPHLARALVGPDFPRLIPTAALLGGGYLLFIDTLARTAAPVEIPLGILTAVIGTPFFIWLLAGMQRNWS